jgi:catechol 2,3-dioxygenase-like lactoylglutathione lyase family enzyme
VSFRLERLDHVALTVSDRRRSIVWYRDILGLRQLNDSADDDWPIFVGELGTCIALFQAGVDAALLDAESGRRFHIAFMVGRDDLERAQAHLHANGIAFRFEDHGSAHSIYFADPDGYRLELTTYDV